MKLLRIMIVGGFLIGLIVVVIFFNITKQRLLIVHSYNKEYAWTRDVDIGIQRIFKNKSDYVMRWFYMDTKRHPWEYYKVNSGLAVQKLVNNWHPAVVIAVDDDAQKFAMQFLINRTDVQVVFAGVNNSTTDYGYDKAINVTGILERLPLTALKETLLEIAERLNIKYPPRVLFLGDKSATVRGDEEFFSTFDWKPLRRMQSRLVETYDEWKKAVYEAVDITDFIVVSNYRQILRTRDATVLVPADELIAWTERNSHPIVIGTNVFYASDGGMLAIGTSPYEQGMVAAKMAKDLLDNPGKVAKSIPITISKEFVVSMRESRIQAHHIQLPSVYAAAAKTADNYYEGFDDEASMEIPNINTFKTPIALSSSITSMRKKTTAAVATMVVKKTIKKVNRSVRNKTKSVKRIKKRVIE